MTKYDLRLETKTYCNKRIFASHRLCEGYNQDKSLLNLNSDAYTNARLRDTITNNGFRIDTNACVLSDEKSCDCRLSDLSRTILGLYHFASVLAKRYQSTIYPKYWKMEDTARLRVQYLLAMAYDIVEHQQLNIHVYI
jgi:hypothetical protein